MVVCGDGLAGVNLGDSCQQVVRYVDRRFFIELVDLHVFVIIVRTALEATLRKFDVLRGNLCQYFVKIIIWREFKLRSYFVRHVDDGRSR